MNDGTIIKQDKSEDLTVQVTTTQTISGYITNISIHTELSIIIEEIKTPSLELAVKEHEKSVARLIKHEELIRPEVSAQNPYLYGAQSFTKMLPGVVE